MNIKQIKSFTLVEITIVVAIMGLVTAFSIGAYTKSVKTSQARNIVQDLIALNGAQQQYKARVGKYWIPSGGYCTSNCISAINSALKTKIVPGDFTFSMNGTAATYVITATYVDPQSSGNFSIVMDQRSVRPGINPCCQGSNNCPKVPMCP